MKRPLFCAALILAVLGPRTARGDRAGAEKFVEEGRRLTEARDLSGAERAFSGAIEQDPGWAEGWGRRGQVRRMSSRLRDALQDLARAVELDPKDGEWRIQRVQAWLTLDQVPEALEDAEVLKSIDPNPSYLTALGAAQIRAGQIDRGLESQAAALEQAGGHPMLRVRAEGFLLKGEWDAALKEIDDREAGGVREAAHWYFRTVALVEKGDYEGAAKAVEGARSVSRGTIAVLSAAYLAATPEAGAHASRDRAVADCALAAKDHHDSLVLNAWARALWLAGRARECLDLLSTRGRRANFGTNFWLGASYWKLGEFAEARAVLRDAWRLNPYLVRHAARMDGFREFVAGIDREMAAERPAEEDRGRLGYELATHLLTVAEIETLVRRYRFEAAVSEYEKLRQTIASAVRRTEVDARLPEIRAMASAHGRVLGAVKASPGKLKTRAGSIDLAIQAADGEAFDFTIRGGSGRYPWAYLGIGAYCELASAQALPVEDLFGLGCLAYEAGDEALSVTLFESAQKKDPGVRGRVTGFLARRRGAAAPEGGFVSWRGAWVTPDEKKNLEKGLARWQDRWVSARDRDQLARGMTLVGGKWVAADEAELTRLGYRKYRDRWMSGDDLAALRRQWPDAWTAETAHWQVRSNEGEAFAMELADALEAAWTEMNAEFGAAPRGPARRLQAFAFRSYEDYRACCVDSQAQTHLNAAGFARRDAALAAGWNKTGNRRQFLQTMLHEAAHLFYALSFPDAKPPSFHAECWALHYFLARTDNTAWRDGYAAWRTHIAGGGGDPLTRFLPDPAAFEADWIRFVLGL